MANNIPIKTKSPFVFIDAENVRNGVQQYGYKDLDYSKLYKYLKVKKKASRIFVYTGIETGDIEKEERYIALKKLGYEVSIKKVMSYKQQPWHLNTTCPHCKKNFIRETYIKDRKKANCDTEMTLDIIRYGIRRKYTSILVFSGDGDFAKVYEYVVKDLKKNVCVVSPSNHRTALSIKELAKKEIIVLEDLGGLLQHYGSK